MIWSNSLPTRDRALRQTLRLSVGLACLALLINTWCLEGIFMPLITTSGSMALALLGPHRDVTCSRCGLSFVCDSQSPPADGRAVCPNCGFADNDLATCQQRVGDRIWIDRASFEFRQPRRWEVVALQSPLDATQLCVKRIVGLPGETIEIREGHVIINGQIARKSLDECDQFAVLVHDQRFVPKEDPQPRWRAQDDAAWQPISGGFVHSGQTPAIDWLTYHHFQPASSVRGASAEESPILDDVSYNQDESRVLSPVRDLMLRYKIQAHGDGLLVLRIHGEDQFTVHVRPSMGEGDVTHNGAPGPHFSIAADRLANPTELLLVLADHQLQLAFGGEPAVIYPYDRSTATGAPIAPTQPLAIGCENLSMEIHDLQVLRDIYYTAAPNRQRATQSTWRLADDEYFLLGDNSPISDDSRTWPAGAVRAAAIIGKPLFTRR